MRSMGNCQQYLRLMKAHKPRIVFMCPAQGDFGLVLCYPDSGHGDYDGVSSEGRVELVVEGHSVDESNLSVGVRLRLPLHASLVSDLRFVGRGAHKQHQSHHQSHHHHQQPPPPNSFFSEKASGPPIFQPCNSGSKHM
ncbi:unnamed protein product [Sphagnum jensenii]|uniref:Uncharacterized protein n=1 Tax=Sphagnum jensenii TaxID=128206 RepID=A0ABP0W8I8_9BRYO